MQEYGSIIAQIVTSAAQIPVAGATLTISRELPDGGQGDLCTGVDFQFARLQRNGRTGQRGAGIVVVPFTGGKRRSLCIGGGEIGYDIDIVAPLYVADSLPTAKLLRGRVAGEYIRQQAGTELDSLCATGVSSNTVGVAEVSFRLGTRFLRAAVVARSSVGLVDGRVD